ncbi:AbiH family protein [Acinetobacter defluvii]|uniref:AbiH family protein n=1 Tax=Acinetobacter defluvii TaxID=1871111 RepID=UPI002B3FFE39|nr:AbiH family protein [Acinetobacter defluvii]
MIKHKEYSTDSSHVILRKKESYILSLLNILIGNFYIQKEGFNSAGLNVLHPIQIERNQNWNNSKYELNNKYISEFKSYCEFNFPKVVFDLQCKLDDFIVLFEGYLIILKRLDNKNKLNDIHIMNNLNLLKIYSFNYTKTSEKLYGCSNIDFLHGDVEKSNMVLGVSDLDRRILEKYNFYGFVKYHQKLIKETNYNFILEDNEVMNTIKNARGDFYKDGYDLNIIIWGHSLDQSDGNYIKEIFSLNEKEEQVKIIIYFFNKAAYFDLLSNLFLILGNDKVELWMKKGWLKFEKNPDIAKINDIKPVELPQT